MLAAPQGAPGGGARLSWSAAALFFCGVTLLAAAVYAPALSGPFLSDDALYRDIVESSTAHGLGPETLVAILDPRGDAVQASANYAPVHLFAYALEWSLFGERTASYHVLNLLLHGLNATLLVLLLRASRVPRLAALAAGALFVVHPANVEAVAWISQQKTLLALAFALGALLALERRPRLSAGLFALGLLSKPVAAFALPAAAAFVWAWRRAGTAERGHGIGLALWAAVLALYAVPEFVAFHEGGRSFVEPYPDAWTQLRSMAAIGARYLAMAATGWGTSAFHEPPPVTSPWDPWWWCGLALGGVLLGRIAVTLRRGRLEAAWWLGAAAAFAPVSQIFPFYFGMGDRYLYCILPGLLGGGLLWGGELLAAAARRLPALARPAAATGLRTGALALGAALGLLFALHASGRAGLWTSEYRLLADGAGQYPDGGTAHFMAALAAVQRRDADAAFASLRRANERGYHFIRSYQLEPGLAPLRADPRFQALLVDAADRQIAFAQQRRLSSRRDRRGLAAAYYVRGDLDVAIEMLEALIREGGPQQDALLVDLQRMRSQRAEMRRGQEP